MRNQTFSPVFPSPLPTLHGLHDSPKISARLPSAHTYGTRCLAYGPYDELSVWLVVFEIRAKPHSYCIFPMILHSATQHTRCLVSWKICNNHVDLLSYSITNWNKFVYGTNCCKAHAIFNNVFNCVLPFHCADKRHMWLPLRIVERRLVWDVFNPASEERM